MDHNSGSAWKKETIPWCPDIKFKEIPNYEVTDILIPPTFLVDESGPNCVMHKAQFPFILTLRQATEIAALLHKEDVQPLPSVKILLRFCAVDEMKEEQEDMFPPGLRVFLSGGKVVELDTNPLDISKYVECDLYRPNTFIIVWLENPCNERYCIALYILKLRQDDAYGGHPQTWKQSGTESVQVKVEPSAGPNAFGLVNLRRSFKLSRGRHGVERPSENAVVSKSKSSPVKPSGIKQEFASSPALKQETCVGSSQVVPDGSGAEPEPMCVPLNKKRKELPCSSSGKDATFVSDSAPSVVASLPISESSGNEGNDGPFWNRDDNVIYEVIFSNKDNPKETFTLKLIRKSRYFDMATEVGKKLGVDPEYIQFFKLNPNKDSLGRGRPIRLSQDDYELLPKLREVYTPTSGTFKLLYQVLEMPPVVPEEMNQKRFALRFYSHEDNCEREVIVFVNKPHKITAKDVLLEVSKVVSGGDRVMPLRMLKVFQCRIANIVDNDFCADFTCSIGIGYYRAEEILNGEEDLSENEMLVPVAHFEKEIRYTFGVPFLVKVCFGETWLSLKKKIQIRLGLKKEQWVKIKIALVSPRCVEYVGRHEDNLPLRREFFEVKPTWIGLNHPYDGPAHFIE